MSAAPPVDRSAQAQVLDALRASGLTINPALSAHVGAPVVSPDECDTALSRVASGLSPGPDGIPTEVYRKFSKHLSRLLASVLSAVGRTGQVPPGFLDGVLIALFKKGDATVVANYRPITLLNTDYRLLAKVLAARLGPALGGVIGPEQSAFLQGRQIGDNVMFLQLLPTLLRAEKRGAAVAFLDFVKAYDTVDRSFLLAAMECMGVGAGFMRWVRTLLSHTPFVALINGFCSHEAHTRAGVRQGCPLSPLLYLFVAQALQCWLLASDVGIMVAGARRAATQFADDTQA